jgi:hypothetical protein
MPALRGRGARHDHLVPFAGADLVVATGTSIRLRSLVRLHVPDLDVIDVVEHGRSHGTDPGTGFWSSGQRERDARRALSRTVRRVRP